jgi:CYTH domain-containing protein
MVTERRFLIAPSFTRLIRKELGSSGRIVEGYFPPQPERNQIVRVDRNRCELVLFVKGGDGATSEERAEVPRPHAEALMEVAAGTVAFDRTPMPLGREILLDTFVAPAGLHLLTVPFGEGEKAEQFYPPTWFGREVTGEDAFQSSTIALNGAPAVGPLPITDQGLDDLLNILERQTWRSAKPEQPAAVTPGKAERPAPSPARELRARGVQTEGALQTLARALARQTQVTPH